MAESFFLDKKGRKVVSFFRRKGVIKVAKRDTEITLYDPFKFGLFSPDVFDFAPFRWPIWRTDWLEIKEPVIVEEEDGKMIVRAEVPGIPAEELKVLYDKRGLRIMAQHEEKTEKEGVKRQNYREVDFLLDLQIDADKAEATLADGILTLRAPKGEKVEPTKIPVKVAKN